MGRGVAAIDVWSENNDRSKRRIRARVTPREASERSVGLSGNSWQGRIPHFTGASLLWFKQRGMSARGIRSDSARGVASDHGYFHLLYRLVSEVAAGRSCERRRA